MESWSAAAVINVVCIPVLSFAVPAPSPPLQRLIWFVGSSKKYAVVFVGKKVEQYIGSPSTEKTLGEEIYCADLKEGSKHSHCNWRGAQRRWRRRRGD
jgi:hypothetical protein